MLVRFMYMFTVVYFKILFGVLFWKRYVRFHFSFSVPSSIVNRAKSMLKGYSRLDLQDLNMYRIKGEHIPPSMRFICEFCFCYLVFMLSVEI